MKMTNNTILITGGTSGIGLELAGKLIELGNTVLITGRDQSKLDKAKQALPAVHIFKSDVSDQNDMRALRMQILASFPQLNILINNAGIMRKINLHETIDGLSDITHEIEINLSGPILMVQQFLPHLKSQDNAAIINVTSGLAFVPMAISPIYCASKAALHSYTQSLRLQLKRTSIKVFELAPPGTETPLFRGDFTVDDVKEVKVMAVDVLVEHAIKGLEKDHLDIRPGLSNVLNILSRLAPQFAANLLGKSVDAMLDQVAS